ncbi:MAG: hypothetical protein ACRDPR_07725 [Nocardioidaceae bacterium]
MRTAHTHPHNRTVPALWRQVVRSESVHPEVAQNARSGRFDRPTPRVDHRDMDLITPLAMQLAIYDGLLRAFDRRSELMDVIAAAPDRDSAVRRVADLLGLDDGPATAVLDQQLGHFTVQYRNRIAARAEELRAHLTG